MNEGFFRGEGGANALLEATFKITTFFKSIVHLDSSTSKSERLTCSREGIPKILLSLFWMILFSK